MYRSVCINKVVFIIQLKKDFFVGTKLMMNLK